MTLRPLVAALTVGVLATGCGGEGASDPSVASALSVLAGSATFSATTSNATLANGVLTVEASGTSNGVSHTLSIALQSTTTGTFAVGSVGGASVDYTERESGASVAKAWRAGNGSGSGTITLSELSTSRVIGTFAATLPPVTASGAAATKTLTGGAFTIKLVRP